MSSTKTASTTAEPVPGVPKRYFRGDIEGLRAIAVVLVILDHLIGWPVGGFIGVDVFFVLSGFLISGLLLREYEKTQTISFLDFYGRRVRRIAPAATLVIIVTVVVGFAILSVARAQEVLTDGLWAFFFSANWHFASIGTDYFQATSAVSPLQHYWSLSVEEQFYLVWPWLSLLLLVVFRSRARIKLSTATAKERKSSTMKIVGFVFLGVTVLSFAWACYNSLTNPALAYFDTFSRVWELAIGATIAAFSTQLGKIPAAARPVLAWLGIIGIVFSAFFITSSMPFPGPTAALPVISTCLIVVAGITGPRRFIAPLDNPVTRYLGRISYSLYLWHFPIITYLAIILGRANPLLIPYSIAAILVFSILSFHLVEDPIRRSNFLKRKKSPKNSRRSKQSMEPQSKIAVGGLIFAAAAAMAIIIFALGRVAPVTPPSQLAAPESIAATSAPVDVSAAETRKTAIQDALRATDWPQLTPAVADYGQNGRNVIASEWLGDGCLGDDGAKEDDPVANTDHCVYPPSSGTVDPAKTAVIFGDSLAISYAPAIRNALGSDWQVSIYALAGCPASAATVNQVNGSAYPECGTFRDWATNKIKTDNPALVFISEATDDIRLASGAKGDAADTEWRTAVTTTMTALTSTPGKVIMLNRPPAGQTLYDCQTPQSKPSDCVTQVPLGYQNRDNLLRSVINQVGGNARFVDTTTWFCNVNQCPSFVGTSPVFADGVHLTQNASRDLAPLVALAVSQATAAG